MSEEKQKPISFGFQNGWRICPPLVEECHSKGHKTTSERISRIEVKVVCAICNYEYRYDDGD